MSTSDGLAREPFQPPPRPWTLEGDVDLDYDDDTRHHHHAALTDAGLISRFRRQFPRARTAEYDAMVRALGYVWDCIYDATANVTGFSCATCGRSRGEAGR
jgi:hypothetical protein